MECFFFLLSCVDCMFWVCVCAKYSYLGNLSKYTVVDDTPPSVCVHKQPTTTKKIDLMHKQLIVSHTHLRHFVYIAALAKRDTSVSNHFCPKSNPDLVKSYAEPTPFSWLNMLLLLLQILVVETQFGELYAERKTQQIRKKHIEPANIYHNIGSCKRISKKCHNFEELP